MTIGILGGGQLGYMLALAGYPLGLHFRFLDPSPEAPVGRIAQRVTADFSDQAALVREISLRALMQVGGTNVNSALLRLLDDPELRTRLGDAALAEARDRYSWKAHTRRILDALAARV